MLLPLHTTTQEGHTSHQDSLKGPPVAQKRAKARQHANPSPKPKPPQKLCGVDKSGVLECSRLWEVTVARIAPEAPSVVVSHLYVDACCTVRVSDPTDFDVIVSSNLFGDVLSDLTAGLLGSLGFLPSASDSPVPRHDQRPVRERFQPVQRAGRDVRALTAVLRCNDRGAPALRGAPPPAIAASVRPEGCEVQSGAFRVARHETQCHARAGPSAVLGKEAGLAHAVPRDPA